MNKRTFLKSTAALSLGSMIGLPAWSKAVDAVTHLPAEAVASDEDFWVSIRGGYKLKPDYINLENGYYCILPQEILDQYIEHIREVNMHGAHYMRTVQFENKATSAKRLAELAGCTSDELIITRNTTESLDMIISGLDWKKGDEAIMAEHDYGAMLDMFKQVSKRYGTVNKIVSVPLHPQSDEEIVDLYAKAITRKTKLLMVCHIINVTGQVLPIRKICDMAHSRGVQVMVDGAHAFAQLQYNIPDLHCDYYGASLHKWLSTPLGAGFLYVKKEHIPKIWPLFAESGKADNDILRLNHTGTHSAAVDLTICNALDFYQKIGAERKEARLRYLQHYWTSQVRNNPNVILNTPADQKRSCGIANVGVKGMKPADLVLTLLQKYKIYTVAIDKEKVQGCRITPNIYTTTGELDILVNALKEMTA
jgi:selenocysteine lyase/cysteine desulfurase